LKHEALAMFELYNVQLQQFDLSKENLAAAKLNLQLAEEKYRNGALSSFNYRDVQLIYLDAALSEVAVRYQVLESGLELKRLTGNILSLFN
ncbi:MAG: TolC family protein, partial [Bacteroidales bacterium]|nr:TolC family protein [Bacteroidales bacterium]